MMALLLDRPSTVPAPRPVGSYRPNVRPSGYLPTLDGWRAVAILGVLVCHGADGMFESESLGHRLTRHGALGVNLFFAISGFLITARLLEERRKRGQISLRGFYIRRVTRIMPAYFAYLFVLAALAVVGLVSVSAPEWLGCAVFVRNYLSPRELGGWFTGHFWSLAVEEHFYLLWPTALVLLGTVRARWCVALFAFVLGVWRVLESRHQWLNAVLPGVDFFGRTDIRLDGLLWGCWLALLVDTPMGKAWLTRGLRTPVWYGLVVAFVLCVATAPPLAMTWQAILISLILAGTVLRPKSPVGRVLENQTLRWIGCLSYSLYLWQQLFLSKQGLASQWPLNSWQRISLSMAAVFVCAMASYYFVEKPAIRLGHRLAAPATPGRA